MVADKFHSDEFLRNTDYADVGGITNKEINRLEQELVSILEFDLFIDQEKFEAYNEKLLQFAQIQERVQQKRSVECRKRIDREDDERQK